MSIDFEIELSIQYILYYLREKITIQKEFNIKDDEEDEPFTVEIKLAYSKNDIFYYVKYFNELKKKLTPKLPEELSGFVYAFWEEEKKEVPQGKTKQEKEEKEKIEEWNSNHIIRHLTIHCKINFAMRILRKTIKDKVVPHFIHFIKKILENPNINKQLHGEEFYYIKSMSYFAPYIDRYFNPCYKEKRQNRIPLYIIKAIQEEAKSFPTVKRVEFDIDEKTFTVYTNIFIPKRQIKRKREE